LHAAECWPLNDFIKLHKETTMVSNGISTGNLWLSQLSQRGNTNQAYGSNDVNNSSSLSGKGDIDSGQSPGGKLLSAISDALSQIGVNASATSGPGTDASSSSTQDPAKALASFMHELMAALHSQNSAQTAGAQGGTDGDGDNDGSGAGGVGAGGRHHSNIQADLQSLMQQLSSSGSSGTNSADGSLTNLQQSFFTGVCQ
jgi:hypothetical protein